MGMPDRFNDVGVQIEAWAVLESGNTIIGCVLEVQDRRSGNEGKLLVIRLTESGTRVRTKDGEHTGRKGEVIAIDLKEGLKPLLQHVGTDAEIYIHPVDKVETSDGDRTYWRFQLGATSVQGPKG